MLLENPILAVKSDHIDNQQLVPVSVQHRLCRSGIRKHIFSTASDAVLGTSCKNAELLRNKCLLHLMECVSISNLYVKITTNIDNRLIDFRYLHCLEALNCS